MYKEVSSPLLFNYFYLLSLKVLVTSFEILLKYYSKPVSQKPEYLGEDQWRGKSDKVIICRTGFKTNQMVPKKMQECFEE